MLPDFWHERWERGEIAFHRDAVHQDLQFHADWLLGGGPHRVLVPLCGKTRDLGWIAAQGHDVVGIELSPVAAAAVFAELGVEPEVVEDGSLVRHHHGRLTVICGDIFDVRPDDVGPVDRIWDRAALIALPPRMRKLYAPRIRALSQPGGRLLQSAIEYNACAKDGPPFSVDEDEVRRLYQGADVSLFERRDATAEIRPPWAEAGMTRLSDVIYRIVLPGGR